MVYAQLGQAYLDLGFTGKAGLAFSHAKAIFESHHCQIDAKRKYMLNHSRYLCFIGNVDMRYINGIV
jgi:hypothetical protein